MKGQDTHKTIVVGREYYEDALQSTRSYEVSRETLTMRYGDRGHWGYPDFPPHTDVGGPFYLEGVRTSRSALSVGTIWRGGALKQNYRGSLVVDVPHTGAWVGTYLPDSWGAKAYSNMKPTRPIMNALNSFYELKDVPGMFRELKNLPNVVKGIQDRYLSFLGHSGKAYVGGAFGWGQLYQDTVNLFNFQQKAAKRLAWLVRNNGKPIPTSTVILDTDAVVEDYAISGYGLLQPVLVTQYYVYEPRGRRLTHNKEKIWAKGQFQFWLPSGPQDINWTTAMKARLFGLNPTPSVIYRAIPWTWLFDWFGHMGTMLENMESGVANRCAANYWYIMREKSWSIENQVSGWFQDPQGNPVNVHGTSTSTAFVKTRSVGDPFGMGTDALSLNPGQLAILGALGLSKIR